MLSVDVHVSLHVLHSGCSLHHQGCYWMPQATDQTGLVIHCNKQHWALRA